MRIHPWRFRIFLLNALTKLRRPPLKYDELAPLLESIDPHEAMEILKQFEDNAASVRDPTGWVAAAARRAYLKQLEEEMMPLPTPLSEAPGAHSRAHQIQFERHACEEDQGDGAQGLARVQKKEEEKEDLTSIGDVLDNVWGDEEPQEESWIQENFKTEEEDMTEVEEVPRSRSRSPRRPHHVSSLCCSAARAAAAASMATWAAVEGHADHSTTGRCARCLLLRTRLQLALAEWEAGQ